jgi:hypothetical protein
MQLDLLTEDERAAELEMQRGCCKRPDMGPIRRKKSCQAGPTLVADIGHDRYVDVMRLFSSIVAAGCLMLLAGCSVEINATQTVARAASSTDVHDDREASSDRPDGAGAWVTLTALIGREDVQRVARWQVYPHAYVVECSSGRETNVGTEPRLEGIDFADANAVKASLKDHPAKQVYQMQSLIFARAGSFKTPQCLQFRGGSYTGQKIAEARIPIRLIGSLP